MKIRDFILEETDEPAPDLDEVESAQLGIDTACEHMRSLSMYEHVVRGVPATEQLSITAAKILSIAIEDMARDLGMQSPRTSLAVEGFDDNRRSIALESVASVLKSIWKGIKDTFAWIWKKIKSFFGFNDDKKQKARLKKAAERSRALAAAAKKGQVVKNASISDLTSLASKPGATHVNSSAPHSHSSPSSNGSGSYSGSSLDETLSEPFRYTNKKVGLPELMEIIDSAEEAYLRVYSYTSIHKKLTSMAAELLGKLKDKDLHGFCQGYDVLMKTGQEEKAKNKIALGTVGTLKDIDSHLLAERHALTLADINDEHISKIGPLLYGATIVVFQKKSQEDAEASAIPAILFQVIANGTKETDNGSFELPGPHELEEIAKKLLDFSESAGDNIKLCREQLEFIEQNCKTILNEGTPLFDEAWVEDQETAANIKQARDITIGLARDNASMVTWAAAALDLVGKTKDALIATLELCNDQYAIAWEESGLGYN